MPVYYKERPDNLTASIESILGQSLQANEIIIVKDGPLTDGLDAVIQKYASVDDRFKVIALKQNVGLGIALNSGITAATNEIIARMDSDDIAMPSRFYHQATYMSANPEVAVISANVVEFDGQINNIVSRKNVPMTHGEIISSMRRRNPLNHMAVMYRKAAVLRAGGYEDCPFFEDYYLWTKIFAQGGKFYNIQLPLVYARTGSGMIARRGGLNYAKHIIYFQTKAFRTGALTMTDALSNAATRLAVAATPIPVRDFVYKKMLRSHHE